MEISGNLSKQLFSTGFGRITLKNCLRDCLHLLKSPHFRLQVLRCDSSYSHNILRKMINLIAKSTCYIPSSFKTLTDDAGVQDLSMLCPVLSRLSRS